MNVWRVRIEESTGRVFGEAESIVAPAPAVNGITFSRNGQMAFSTLDQRTTIERLTLDPAREEIAGPAEVAARFMPDWLLGVVARCSMARVCNLGLA